MTFVKRGLTLGRLKLSMKKFNAASIDLEILPGHHIRRLQQIAVAIFLQETEATGVTPVQYAALQTVSNTPGIDQRTLARTIGFDTSTIAGVVDRLEARGLLQRNASAEDRRVRMLTLTSEGQALLDTVIPGMQRAQARMLAPLPRAERVEFMRMLRVLVNANNELSRAPREDS
jgi:MarR family transcriptional regulator, lower aerobic nicotinate degradation pathway regulator